MSYVPTSQPIREAVGVFHDDKSLLEAIDELTSHGFGMTELSLLAGAGTVEKKLGHAYTRVSDLEDDATVPRIAFVPPESLGEAQGLIIGTLMAIGGITAAGVTVASGGALAATIGAAAGAGGLGALIGGVLSKLIHDHHAKYLQTQLDRGGLLLWVRTWDPKKEKEATEILRKHSADDVHVHDISVLQDHSEQYQSVEVAVHADGSCTALGATFESLEDAKAFIAKQALSA